MALKVKFAMALYQKLDFIRSTIYVESFIIVSRSAQNAQFFALCRCTNSFSFDKTGLADARVWFPLYKLTHTQSLVGSRTKRLTVVVQTLFLSPQRKTEKSGLALRHHIFTGFVT